MKVKAHIVDNDPVACGVCAAIAHQPGAGQIAPRDETATALADSQRQAAEAVMAMDLLGRLSTVQSEQEAIMQLIEVFTALFAPRALFYLSTEEGQLDPIGAETLSRDHLAEVRRFAAGTAPYRETFAKNGFLLRVRCGVNTLGIFSFEDFAAPQYARQYLNLALHMMDLCGMAIKRARTAEKLLESEARYHTLFSSMQEGFALHEMICDARGQPANYRFFDVNPAFERLTGLRREHIIGRTVLEVLPDTELLWIQRYGNVALTGVAQRFEEFSAELGKHYDVYVYSPRQDWFAVIFSDITVRRRAEERIRHLAHHDPLTNLPNRTLLAERTALAVALAARRQESLALLFCDLDHFKDINDSLGHLAGDELLTQMADRFKAVLRQTDTVARLGGDEFIILLPEVTRDQAAHLAEKLLTTLRKPIDLDGHRLTVTGSIGISLYPHDGADFATLLQNADVAMYRAKQAGRHQFWFYDTRMNAEILERLTLLAELENAIHAGQLRTYFQPKVSLLDGSLMGAEALVRWQHPQKGLLLPGRFIPAAEDTDLIVAIGQWVLEDVCRYLTSWESAGYRVPTVAVNLAARHFRDPQLAAWLGALLERYAVPAAALQLELTESTLLDRGAETGATIEALRRLGLHLAIDDFGTGYSNLAYLKNLPVAELKIDRSFVRDLENDLADRAIAAAVVSLSHNLGLKVVGEGVETEGQRMILLEQGCDCAQGYLFSYPLPAKEFIEWRWNGEILKTSHLASL
jgi:diguanylate cyclase (GGDEF)-like protein/PAS domain S-box-containing protein